MYATIDSDGSVHPLSGIPGLLTYPPYYWWEAGAMFGQLIDYWYYTNDSTYNDMVRDGLLHQIGDSANLMPANQSKDEGNDDQLFWAFSVMSAVELNFPNPPDDKPGWLAVAQSVMNQLIGRYQIEEEGDVCGGGLRWQIYQWLGGYNYKNTAANGGMFQLGARLAKYTGNATYAEWAEKAFDWMAKSPLMTSDWKVYDGTDVLKGCQSADQTQWSYNYGIMIGGAAYMYNYTNGSALWQSRIEGFLNHTSYFFPDYNSGVMTEVCERNYKCNIDQPSFKAYLARWLAVCAQLAPFTYDRILPLLQHSAVAAAQSCDAGNQCGMQWYVKGFDGHGGVGQQMSALSVISANLIGEVKGPYTKDDGGTSKGNPAAGTGDEDPTVRDDRKATTADKAGASIVTILVVVFVVGGGYWLVLE
ncbi:glycoside hydrolase family 76 protein [Aaosphaeria arxii CBS 175.79]|uniref:Mannan endo-1,6-alpha-mannosidase n=1 Tax=Aaosphaeria arxii CBS 175.79 TaxID=1450172 RepID=A0A6A5XTT2_9PLEO|nr:glycoside hydrolase family 76 protein [Aaosphaeria arxii CBS 175.79]KAF2015654.1 glycoside hydrolase family 76 protein [Aaosphaeria arxii CBS 175.79]